MIDTPSLLTIITLFFTDMSGLGHGHESFWGRGAANKQIIQCSHTSHSKSEPKLGDSSRLPLVVIFVTIDGLLYFWQLYWYPIDRYH